MFSILYLEISNQSTDLLTNNSVGGYLQGVIHTKYSMDAVLKPIVDDMKKLVSCV